jgi:hypothetical protein
VGVHLLQPVCHLRDPANFSNIHSA